MMPEPCDSCNCGPALSYLGAGLSVLPIRPDGSKAPMLPAWESLKSRLPTEAEVRGWFDHTPTPGIGIIGGNVSGRLLVIDFEFLDFFEEWLALVDAQAPGLAARLPLVRTPGKDDAGGRHAYARTSGPAVPTGKLARITRAEAERRTGDPGRITAVEVKAEKGYVLTVGCPAACHPTGRLYEHISGPAIEQTPTLTAAEVDLLLTCARALERGDRASADRPLPRPQGGDLRPGDRFNRDADWFADVLGDGWRKVRDNGQVVYLCRPGKSEGVSATIGYCRTELAGPKLYVFSTNAMPFEAERSYSKFDAYTLLRHGGDFAAAARELASRGYGTNGRGPTGTPSANGTAPSQQQPVEGEQGRTGYDIILAYFKRRYAPVFRSGRNKITTTTGAEVLRSEACTLPGIDLIDALAEATDAPRTKQGIVRDELPRFFRNWAPVAWADLVDDLPEEEDSAEVNDMAKERFRARVSAALNYIVSIGYQHKKGEAVDVQRRSLIELCAAWAKPGKWESVRSYNLWTRKEPGEPPRLRVALRVELFSQIARGSLEMTQNKFDRLAELYGVGIGQEDFKVKGRRCTELAPEFIDRTLNRLPQDGAEPPVDDSPEPHACACEVRGIVQNEVNT